jgi:hypothetical protein
VVLCGFVVESEVSGRVMGSNDVRGPVRSSGRVDVGRDRLRPVALTLRWEVFGFAQADNESWKKVRISPRCSGEKLISSKRSDCRIESMVLCVGSVMV